MNKQAIITAIYNELIHSKHLRDWNFNKAAADIVKRLEKLGIVGE